MSNLKKLRENYESELENKKLELENLQRENEKAQYTEGKKKLSDFIKEFIDIFGNGNCWRKINLSTEFYDYQYKEFYGKATIVAKSKSIITTKKFLWEKSRPELEIKIMRDFSELGKREDGYKKTYGYNYISGHIEKGYEREEERHGYKILPIMEIKTSGDIDYESDEKVIVSDDKIPYYLNILKDDLELYFEQKIVNVKKGNGID
jgi:hypothetical protein